MAERRLRKIDILERDLPQRTTLAEIKLLAASLKLMKDRYMARPAAELLVERGDAEASLLSAGLAATPVLGRDPHGDRLRAAFKQALATEGIPSDVEKMARRFYARRGQKSSPKQRQSEDWIATSDTGGPLSALRRLFGGR